METDELLPLNVYPFVSNKLKKVCMYILFLK